MYSKLSLAVFAHEQYKDRSLNLAKQLSLPVCENGADGTSTRECSLFDFILEYKNEGTHDLPFLSLSDPTNQLGGSLHVDFVGGKSGHRRRFGGGRGQPLARAIGLKARTSPTVVDATAGLGRDAFVLASLGTQVTLVERSPVLVALLDDAMQRALADHDTAPIIRERMKLVNADATEWLHDLPTEYRPDVIYMDPMYPHRDKSALVKKEMRYLRELVGDDEDSCQLLYSALACAKHRVVVKRPRNAPIVTGTLLKNRLPSTAIESKNTRYDIYLK